MPYNDQILSLKQRFSDCSLSSNLVFIKSLESDAREILAKLYNKHTAEELLELADIFCFLAALRSKEGDITGNLQCYNDAAIRVQYSRHIIKKYSLLEITSLKNQVMVINDSIIQQLSYIYSSITSLSDKIPDNLLDNSFIHKNELIVLRQEVKLALLTSKQDIAQEVSERVTKGMTQYIAKLFCDAQEIMGAPPCEYSVIGLGSMALHQITPYSDLEFAILTENEDYKQHCDPKIRNYFKNLTHYVHFKVILLGETTIPISHYNLDLKNLIKKAIRFDSGEKTPLGSTKYKTYDLIQTIEGMMTYVRNINNEFEKIDKDLPYIVEATCFIYGSELVAQTYQNQVLQFLLNKAESQESRRCTLRAIRRLSLEAIETDYTQSLDNNKEIKTSGNLEQFDFQTAEEFLGKLFNVKQEIYRLADRFIYNLGLLCGVPTVEGGAWSTIDKLVEGGFITDIAGDNLKNALAYAIMLRLRIYDYYGCQAEEMEIKSSNDSQSQDSVFMDRFHLAEEELNERGSLFEYYYIVLPLIARLKEFCQKHLLLGDRAQYLFLEEDFYQNDQMIIGQIYLRLLKYDAALHCFESALEIARSSFDNKERVAILLTNIGLINNTYLGRPAEALLKFQEALSIMKEIYGNQSLDIAALLNNIGTAHAQLDEYEDAITEYKEALLITKEICGEEHYVIATYLNNIGTIHNRLGQHVAALSYYNEALCIWVKRYSNIHPLVATSLNNIGHSYYAQGNLSEALSKHTEALSIRKEFYGRKHPVVAISLNNIACVYNKWGKYTEALKRYEKALVIWKKTYDTNHPDIAKTLNSIGCTYNKLGFYDQALSSHEEALSIRKALYGNNHLEVAISLNNIGSVYENLKRYHDALAKYEQALLILREIHSDAYSNIAITLNNIGNIHNQLSQYDEAETNYIEALSIRKTLYGDKHQEVAMTLNNIGSMYANLKEYSKAYSYFADSLAIRREIYGEEHLLVAESLSSCGYICYMLGKAQEALAYYKESIAINQLFLSADHPDILDNLKLISVIEEQESYKNLRSLKRKRDNDLSKILSKQKSLVGEPDDSQSSILDDQELSPEIVVIGDSQDQCFL